MLKILIFMYPKYIIDQREARVFFTLGRKKSHENVTYSKDQYILLHQKAKTEAF